MGSSIKVDRRCSEGRRDSRRSASRSIDCGRRNESDVPRSLERWGRCFSDAIALRALLDDDASAVDDGAGGLTVTSEALAKAVVPSAKSPRPKRSRRVGLFGTAAKAGEAAVETAEALPALLLLLLLLLPSVVVDVVVVVDVPVASFSAALSGFAALGVAVAAVLLPPRRRAPRGAERVVTVAPVRAN